MPGGMPLMFEHVSRFLLFTSVHGKVVLSVQMFTGAEGGPRIIFRRIGGGGGMHLDEMDYDVRFLEFERLQWRSLRRDESAYEAG